MTQNYKVLTDVEHLFQAPDVYLGNIEESKKQVFVYENDRILYKEIMVNNGLLKLFDEIFTNAADNLRRDGSNISYIKVSTIDDTGAIIIENDGKSIPLTFMDVPGENKKYLIPEVIFTKFRSGANFSDKKKSTKNEGTTGGKNGLGAKLTVCFSKYFKVEITNDNRLYTQEIEDNMSTIHPYTIVSHKADDMVRITYIPDYQRLKTSGLTPEMKTLFAKRVHDLSHLNLTLSFNDKVFPRISWEVFIRSHMMELPRASDNITNVFTHEIDRWKIGIVPCNSPVHVSYVNNINTYDQGEHVNYILSQIVDEVKNVKTFEATTLTTIKSSCASFIYSIIRYPLFEGQAKNKLTTKSKDFGSTCVLPKDLVKSILKDGKLLDIIKGSINEQKIMIKNKLSKSVFIEDLMEANKAGTDKSGYLCTLFICEGLSAKTMCAKGMDILGHDYYGCYPLRGKVLNARCANDKSYSKNKELCELKEVLGLEDGKSYTSAKQLRYGKVVCVKDADSDGSAIMGLVINFFDTKFPSLLQIKGFFNEFISPMIKIVYNSSLQKNFYNEVEYRHYTNSDVHLQAKTKDTKVFFIKGLATNTTEDIEEMFGNYEDHKIELDFTDRRCKEIVDKAFNAKRADDRKDWLLEINSETHLSREKKKSINTVDFFNTDFMIFSYDACKRSIPSVVDGLKPTQRKILYTMFGIPSLLRDPMKVFQLGGIVANRANYHHGDISMSETIFGMAYNYPASGNNIPLITCNQMGGSRLENGDDHGAARYIGVTLSKAARAIFPKEDDDLLETLIEDDQQVEPRYYCPIIPFVLINGAKGIGTGWSTEIPPYSPTDVIEFVYHLLDKLDGKKSNYEGELRSYYKGFKGDISLQDNRWVYRGKIELDKNKCRIVELPVNYSISRLEGRIQYLKYIYHNVEVFGNSKKSQEKLKDVIDNKKRNITFNNHGLTVVDFENHSTVNEPNFLITFNKEPTEELVFKVLDLEEKISLSNMVLFNKDDEITRYSTVKHIAKEWFTQRHALYKNRKAKMLRDIDHKIFVATNQVKFIELVLGIDIKNIKESDLITILEQKGFEKIDGSYEYILSVRITNLTKDRQEKLKADIEKLKAERLQTEKLSISVIWRRDLEHLQKILHEIEIEEQKRKNSDNKKQSRSSKHDKKRVP